MVSASWEHSRVHTKGPSLSLLSHAHNVRLHRRLNFLSTPFITSEERPSSSILESFLRYTSLCVSLTRAPPKLISASARASRVCVMPRMCVCLTSMCHKSCSPPLSKSYMATGRGCSFLPAPSSCHVCPRISRCESGRVGLTRWGWRRGGGGDKASSRRRRTTDAEATADRRRSHHIVPTPKKRAEEQRTFWKISLPFLVEIPLFGVQNITGCRHHASLRI